MWSWSCGLAWLHPKTKDPQWLVVRPEFLVEFEYVHDVEVVSVKDGISGSIRSITAYSLKRRGLASWT